MAILESCQFHVALQHCYRASNQIRTCNDYPGSIPILVCLTSLNKQFCMVMEDVNIRLSKVVISLKRRNPTKPTRQMATIHTSESDAFSPAKALTSFSKICGVMGSFLQVLCASMRFAPAPTCFTRLHLVGSSSQGRNSARVLSSGSSMSARSCQMGCLNM